MNRIIRLIILLSLFTGCSSSTSSSVANREISSATQYEINLANQKNNICLAKGISELDDKRTDIKILASAIVGNCEGYARNMIFLVGRGKTPLSMQNQNMLLRVLQNKNLKEVIYALLKRRRA